ncbi:MAG: DNA topoisomerase [Chloroflexota bacterium]
MKLVIVDTPAEAKQVADTLDENWRVEPCLGGVRALPPDNLGVDRLHDFQPSYTLLPRKGNLVRRLMRAISSAEAIYMATPGGRIGEAMAWHILALAPSLKGKTIYRTPLTALTPDAIRASFSTPHDLNLNWVEAEISQRIVDRLIAFLISPLANKALDTNLVVTRASLVCLGMLVEHERAIRSFEAETTWSLRARFAADTIEFEAQLYTAQGKTLSLKTREQADSLAALLTHAALWVDKGGSRTIDLNAPSPYTLVSIIADAESRLGIGPGRTLELVQTLYEAGWVTTPNREALIASAPEIEAAQAYIRSAFGNAYVTTASLPVGESATSSYIYPADLNRLPEQLPGDSAALYGLIWRRFVAAWMSPARARQTGARILAGSAPEKPFPLEFRAQSQQLTFEGWMRAGSSEVALADDPALPELVDGMLLALKAAQIEEQVTEPPLPLTPGAFIATLAEKGITRSSEYVAALQMLLDSRHAELKDGMLVPTEQGSALMAFIESHFGSAFSTRDTAQLERDLDKVASGEVRRLDLLRNFWSRFGPPLITATQRILNPDTAQPAITPENHRPVILRPIEEG